MNDDFTHTTDPMVARAMLKFWKKCKHYDERPGANYDGMIEFYAALVEALTPKLSLDN